MRLIRRYKLNAVGMIIKTLLDNPFKALIVAKVNVTIPVRFLYAGKCENEQHRIKIKRFAP